MSRLAIGLVLVMLNNATTHATKASLPFTHRIDLDYRHVVVSFCNASDKFQQWRVNSTEGTVYLAQPHRCMSLAPNAVDLSFPCPPTEDMSSGDLSPDSKSPADQSFRIDSDLGGEYRLNHDCFESDREYGNWGIKKYEDHSNVVTRKCHGTGQMTRDILLDPTPGMTTTRPSFFF